MRQDRLTLALFVVYCLEIGLFLAFIPWTGLWDRGVGQLPSFAWQGFLAHSSTRAAVCAFGVLHLVWGAHDLVLLLSRRSQ